MKNYYVIAVFIAAFCLVSCQDGKKKTTEEKGEPAPTEKNIQEESEALKTLRGEFIYVDNAAVLKGNNFIYGVKIDSMAKKLAAQTDSLKRNEFDMVPVVIQGMVSKNPNEGWEEIVSIKKIVSISKPVSDPAIRIEGGE